MSNEQPAGAPQQSSDPHGGYPPAGAALPPSAPQANPGQTYPGQTYPGQTYPAAPGGTQGYPTQPSPAAGQPSAWPGSPTTGQSGPYAAAAQPQQFAPQYPAQPYPTPQYPAQQYPAQQYPAQQYTPTSQTTGRKPAGSPLLGMVAFGVLVVTTIAAGVALAQVMDAAAALLITAGTTSIDQNALTQMLQERLITSYPAQTAVLNIATPVGFAAWVVGIVATAMNRGRGWGIATIVLGVLAPFILLVIAMLGLGPAFAALG